MSKTVLKSIDILLLWHRSGLFGVCRHARKEERLEQMRSQQAQQESQEVTLVPCINPASRHMALQLAQRAAEQDPHLLSVIQSQPEGWALGPRPASPRRHSPASGLLLTPCTNGLWSMQQYSKTWLMLHATCCIALLATHSTLRLSLCLTL